MIEFTVRVKNKREVIFDSREIEEPICIQLIKGRWFDMSRLPSPMVADDISQIPGILQRCMVPEH